MRLEEPECPPPKRLVVASHFEVDTSTIDQSPVSAPFHAALLSMVAWESSASQGARAGLSAMNTVITPLSNTANWPH